MKHTPIMMAFLKRTNSFIRFLLVGIINTATGLTVIFLLMNVFECSYWTATFIGNSIGAVVSYILNRSFTFGSDIAWKKGVSRFLSIILICYLAAYSLSEKIVQLLTNTPFSYDEAYLSVLIGTGIYTLLNFLGQKYFVFGSFRHSEYKE